MKEKLVPLYV